MNSLMLINAPRKKQPYLVNPPRFGRRGNVRKHRFPVRQSGLLRGFTTPPAWALRANPKRLKRKISRKSRLGHKQLIIKRVIRKISAIKPVKIKALKRRIVGLVKHSPKSHKGAIKMKRRKSHRRNAWADHGKAHAKAARKGWSHRKHRRNPFTFKGAMKGFADTGMILDGSLVVGGMLVTTIAMDFASKKIAWLSTPIGKGLGKLGVAFIVKTFGPKVKISPRYSNMIAIGVIASAVKDVAEIVLPKLGYTGGVKLLGFDSGYSPETSQAQRLGGTGYSPDLAAGGESDSGYAFSE